MRGMFWGAKSFNQPLDKWNTSNVKYMKHRNNIKFTTQGAWKLLLIGQLVIHLLAMLKLKPEMSLIKLSNSIIESGATLKKEYVSIIFENASKIVIELFINHVDLLGDEEQAESIFYALKNRPIQNEQDYREYEELLAWYLGFLPHNEKRQTMLDNTFFYTSSTKKAELFLKYGANINTVDSTGETRLMNEFRSTPLDDDLVIMLLEHGIDVNLKNNHNNTTLDIFNWQNQKDWYQKDKKEIEALLKAKGAKSGAELIYILGDRYPPEQAKRVGQ